MIFGVRRLVAALASHLAPSFHNASDKPALILHAIAAPDAAV
jgi:hypothetical protein